MNLRLKKNILRSNNFCIYGLGTTGMSVVNYFNKEKKIRRKLKEINIWDDNSKERFSNGIKITEKEGKNFFSNALDSADFIVMSPGISLKKAKLKKKLIKNKKKIITDLDLFYLLNPKVKSIIVTGTNGKSTTCKVLEHVLRKNKFKVKLGGNIGKPILDLNLKKNSIVIIEASSFQLAYSQFVKPNYAIILNITNDHLDWHGSFKNYVNSKFKVFLNQKKDNFAFVNNKKFLKKFKNERYKSKIKFVNPKRYKNTKKLIKNEYLNSEANEENMSFVYAISKVLKISEKSLIKSLKTFKGLPHRQEIFYKKNNKIFINDSKATSFEASKFALKNNKNIFWIVGGLPKKGDKFKLSRIKKNIFKIYIIGKHMENFKKYLKGVAKIQLSKTLKNAIFSIYNDTKNIKNKKITILLSPASASYDQFNNFEERGVYFKKLVRKKFK